MAVCLRTQQLTFWWHCGNVSPLPSRAAQAVSCAAEKFWKTSPKLTFLAASRVFLLISRYLRDYRRRMVHYMRHSSTRKLSLFAELRQEEKKKRQLFIFCHSLSADTDTGGESECGSPWKYVRKLPCLWGKTYAKMQSLKASKRVKLGCWTSSIWPGWHGCRRFQGSPILKATMQDVRLFMEYHLTLYLFACVALNVLWKSRLFLFS